MRLGNSGDSTGSNEGEDRAAGEVGQLEEVVPVALNSAVGPVGGELGSSRMVVVAMEAARVGVREGERAGAREGRRWQGGTTRQRCRAEGSRCGA